VQELKEVEVVVVVVELNLFVQILKEVEVEVVVVGLNLFA